MHYLDKAYVLLVDQHNSLIVPVRSKRHAPEGRNPFPRPGAASLFGGTTDRGTQIIPTTTYAALSNVCNPKVIQYKNEVVKTLTKELFEELGMDWNQKTPLRTTITYKIAQPQKITWKTHRYDTYYEAPALAILNVTLAELGHGIRNNSYHLYTDTTGNAKDDDASIDAYLVIDTNPYIVKANDPAYTPASNTGEFAEALHQSISNALVTMQRENPLFGGKTEAYAQFIDNISAFPSVARLLKTHLDSLARRPPPAGGAAPITSIDIAHNIGDSSPRTITRLDLKAVTSFYTTCFPREYHTTNGTLG